MIFMPQKLLPAIVMLCPPTIHHALHRWFTPAKGRVLEIGCGSGSEAVFMASLGYQVTATDASQGMLEEASRLAREHTGAGLVEFRKAPFPLEQGHPLLKEEFDAIVCLAVLMHVPDEELFACACQIRHLLKDHGIFICSFCSYREESSQDQYLFIVRQPAAVSLLFERLGFRLLFSKESADSLGCKRRWHTLVFSLERKRGIRPVDQIESIINRDRKTATYKLALFRALCELAQTSYQSAHFLPGDRVSIPLGLVVV